MSDQTETRPSSDPAAAPAEAPTADYILVALDASPHSTAALAAAAELAAALHVELRGLYVEDINLLRLCALPFGLEIGSFTARPRRLESTHMEREFRVQASLLRKIMADIAGQRRINWSFQVVRGGVTDELLAASASARMLSLGRVGRSPGKRTGSTAQAIARNTQRPVLIQSATRRLSGPFTVVHTDSDAAEHGLELAAQLATQDHSLLTLLHYSAAAASSGHGTGEGQMEQLLEQLAPHLRTVAVQLNVRLMGSLRELLAELQAVTEGTVILPVEVGNWLDEIPASVIVVP